MPDQTKIETFLDQVQTHQHIVHKVSYLYGRTVTDRDDLRQEIMLQLWKSFPSFGGRSSFSTWMYRVALNTAISVKRRHKPALQGVRADQAEAGPEMQPGHTDDQRDLYRVIARLNDIEKAIIMQWLDERSYEEIADTMGMSVKNISVRLVRIKAAITEMFNEVKQA